MIPAAHKRNPGRGVSRPGALSVPRALTFVAEGHRGVPEQYGARMRSSQQEFEYQDLVLVALETTISTARMGTYLTAAGFDRVRAIKFYLWNARLSERFYFPLQCTEVTLRNSIHDVLSSVYGPDWPTDPKFERLVETDTVKVIEKVQDRIQKSGHPISTPRIVAGLSFDFWHIILTRPFDRPIWQTRLRAAFPHLPSNVKRRQVSVLVRDIKTFRNRIAHHEPIIGEDHSKLHTDMLNLVRFRCPETAGWMSYYSRVQVTLRERP